MGKKTVWLHSEKELRIYMLPLRQRLMHEMAVIGLPVTGKQIADRLKITPSAAHHHIRQLESIGLIECDRIEIINGIKARYVRLCDVIVSLGLDMNDLLIDERIAIGKNMIVGFCDDFADAFRQYQLQLQAQAKILNPLNDVASSVLHLTDEEAEEFHHMIRDFFNSHSRPNTDTKPWNFLLAAYCDELNHH